MYIDFHRIVLVLRVIVGVTVVATLVLFLGHSRVAYSSFDSRNVVFTIVSQPDQYHANAAAQLKQDIENQVLELEARRPIVHISHEDFPIPGAWTIIFLLKPLLAKYEHSDVRWVLFLEPHTVVRYPLLLEALNAADKQKDTMWIGYPLSDEGPTIIHHYITNKTPEEDGGFVYPNFASGFAMKMDLIDTLLFHIEQGIRKLNPDFSIDPSFELASLIYGDGPDHGPLLTYDRRFCVESGDRCATYPRPFDTCGSAIPEESIFFAVKTWRGFHSTRVQVVKETWGKHVTNIVFYSDQADPSIPTISTGITNSIGGHCLKTITILKMAVKTVESLPHVKWIFLADDDSIIGVQRLCEVLSCYPGGDEFTVLGERYGFSYRAVARTGQGRGLDYITGGGGTALSVSAARELSHCWCGPPDYDRQSPDDMMLGDCMRGRNRTLTHSPLFHQVRPQDYARDYLARGKPVSFHRHSIPDPYRVYATWFQHDDLALRPRPPRDEL